jgi:RNA polymerase sigma-70 factor (ECF subfamily)
MNTEPGWTQSQSLSDVEDAQLLQRIECHDIDALGALYTRFAQQLYSRTISIVKSNAEAEDIVHDIFLQLWEKASKFDGAKGTVGSWLRRLARNRAIDRTRAKAFRNPTFDGGTQATLELLPCEDNLSPLALIEEQESIDSVHRAIDQLPMSQRNVIRWAYWDGYSQAEITQVTHVPLGTVKTRMRQGLKKLHAILSSAQS